MSIASTDTVTATRTAAPAKRKPRTSYPPNLKPAHPVEKREAIRIAYERGEETLPALSARYGVPAKTISTWAHTRGWAQRRVALRNVAKLTAKQFVDQEAAKYAQDGAKLIVETIADAKLTMQTARKLIRAAAKPKDLSDAVTAWRGAIAERRRALGLDDDAGESRPRALVSVNITGAEHVLSGIPTIEAELMPVPVWDDAPKQLAAPADAPATS